MTYKDPKIYVEHMLGCIAAIDDYTQGDKSHFYQSRMAQDAVVRNLQVLAESSQRLPNDWKEAQSHIPWRDISGFRNILVHDYLGLDVDLIWSVIEQDIDSLRDALEKML